MSLRPQDEDLTHQREAFAAASENLGQALASLAVEAKSLSRSAAKGRPVDLNLLHGLVNDVRNAEESVDLATLDIATASGEDA